MRLKDKVAIVTGAGQGIGEAIVARFVAEGCVVHATDIHQDVTLTSPCTYHKLDVANEGDWKRVVASVIDTSGRIDILINNAGIVESYGQIHETTTKAWQRVVGVNQSGTFFGMREIIPHMRKKRSGSIINFSSIWGTVGAGGAAAYQAAKGAVRTLTKNGAVSYAAEGIRVNSVHPGIIWTPLIQGQSKEMNDGIIAATPMLAFRRGSARKPLMLIFCAFAILFFPAQYLLTQVATLGHYLEGVFSDLTFAIQPLSGVRDPSRVYRYNLCNF